MCPTRAETRRDTGSFTVVGLKRRGKGDKMAEHGKHMSKRMKKKHEEEMGKTKPKAKKKRRK